MRTRRVGHAIHPRGLRASLRNSHRPAACVPAEPKACCIRSGVRFKSLPVVAAAAIVPAVPVV